MLSAVMAHVWPLAMIFACTAIVSFTIGPRSDVVGDVAAAKWTKVPIPDQGDLGEWVLASGSDVSHIAVASDGTIYAAANPTGTNQRLFSSTDNGTTWWPVGQVTATIVDIATVPDDPHLVYYATSSGVYKSRDNGATFAALPLNPGGAGANNIVITSVTVTGTPGGRTVVVATADSDSSQYGGVYSLEEDQFFSTWANAGIGNYDVLAIASPPNRTAVKQLVAVASNESSTIIVARIGSAPWSSVFGTATINVQATAAQLSFPSDYGFDQAGSPFFVGLRTGTGGGGAYKVDLPMGGSGSCVDLNASAALGLNSVGISALTSSGNGTSAFLAAGAAASSSILFSNDGGNTWKRSGKSPSGTSITGLCVAMDFSTSGRVFASTAGAESAFSVSDDSGISWNQTGLIDTQVTSSGVLDFAVSSQYASDGTMFLLTWGGKHSVWRSRDFGASWQRVFSSALPGVDSLSALLISPGYGTEDEALFVNGTSGRSPALWKSSDGGETFAQRFLGHAVDTWAAASGDVMFLAWYDGSNGLVLTTENGGFLFSQPVKAGNQPLKSLAISPGFDSDTTILAGNSVGKVYLSTDNGTTFRQLGQTLPLSATGVGQTSVAFSVDFAESGRVYASSDAPSTSSSRERIFTLVVGQNELWESIDTTFPIGGISNRLCVSGNGGLYVSNMKAVAAATVQGGMERCLDASSDTTFETVIKGLSDGSTLRGLWMSGNQLWALDTTNARLVTFVDTLAAVPTLNSPPDRSGGVDIVNLHLDWETLSGATTYEWQLTDTEEFSDLQIGFEGTTQGSSCRVPTLEVATEYLWRVRASAPFKSPWSTKYSFVTKLGNASLAPQLLKPEPGATDVVVDPVFQWTSFTEAEAYELLLGTDSELAVPLASKMGTNAVSETAWQHSTDLEQGKTYYWRVRAIGSGSSSDWSDVGAFTVNPISENTTMLAVTSSTEAPHIVQVNVPTPVVTSLAPTAVGPPSWLLWGLGVLGIVLVGLLAAILIILIKR